MTLEMESSLAVGGLVVTASDRAARALRTEFHRQRVKEGLSAWNAPAIVDWATFVRNAWEERTSDDSLVLSSSQEQALWAEIAEREEHVAVLLENNLYRLAALAAAAYALICDYAPDLLNPAARNGWDQDAAAFSRWVTAMEKRKQKDHLVSAHSLPHRLKDLLKSEDVERPPLLLVGFDRLLPVQRAVLDAWGIWKHSTLLKQTADVEFYSAADESEELDACAQWCRSALEANPAARLMIVTPNSARSRGPLERALLRGTDAAFEFSLGVPLSKMQLVWSAVLALRWLESELDEGEVDGLLAGGRICLDEAEQGSLLRYMRELRAHQLERPSWTLKAFLGERGASLTAARPFAQRMLNAQTRLRSAQDRPRLLREWAEAVPALLQTMGWPGHRTLNSEEEQSRRAWENALESCAICSFDGKRTTWNEFLRALERGLADTLFTPESLDAPIQIVGPSESAGLTADAVWFLGTDEKNWPASGSTHPFLPLAVQKQAGMPHATAQLDWDLAQSATNRLLGSAQRVRFSFARLHEGLEMRPSELVTQMAGSSKPIPEKLRALLLPLCATVELNDASRVSFPHNELRGGTNVLSTQSQCAFKAFAIYRLNARDWEPAIAGLTPAKRGQLLHAVMSAIWSGPPNGLRTLNDLKALPKRRVFVESHVNRVLDAKIEAGLRERMPARYLALERTRLVRLLDEWLAFESTRAPFTVKETETKKSARIGGLTFSLRLDRVDALQDDLALIVDYKSGAMSAKMWNLPRPEDVQLPLYANFGLAADARIGGLVFANVRSGSPEFAGRIKDARANLLPELAGRSQLVQTPLSDSMLEAWRRKIEDLADEFLLGRSIPDPRQYPKTCEECGLQTLCRIQEFPPAAEPDADGGDDDE